MSGTRYETTAAGFEVFRKRASALIVLSKKEKNGVVSDRGEGGGWGKRAGSLLAGEREGCADVVCEGV